LLVVDQAGAETGEEALILVWIALLKIECDHTPQKGVADKLNLLIVRFAQGHTLGRTGRHDHRIIRRKLRSVYITAVDTGHSEKIPASGLFLDAIGSQDAQDLCIGNALVKGIPRIIDFYLFRD
jgi:hypothetical protein